MSNNKNIRSSQLLSPFGIGQIINFPKEYSLMVCGLDLWDEKIKQRRSQAGSNKINESALRFNERRLEKLLGVNYFVRPFPYRTSSEENNRLTVPCVRFPKWHYCTNHKCGYMKEVELGFASEILRCDICQGKDNKFSKMIPVRFVAVCSEGHIQDVPFVNWVHNGPLQDDGKEHRLFYKPLPGSGDLGSILIKCSCGEKRTLAGLMNIRKVNETVIASALARIGMDKGVNTEFDLENTNDNNPSGEYCKGYRPWLGQRGINDAKRCGKHLQVLIRGGSNVHFSNIVSALYLPEVSADANEYVVKFIETHTREKLLKAGEDTLKYIIGADQYVKNGLIGEEELSSGVFKELTNEDETLIDDSEGTITDLRVEEYEYILNGRNSENTSFKAIRKDFSDANQLAQFFECVVLVEKLKETRVFRGFSRINPNIKLRTEELSNEPVKWLPAVEVFGEGIFLKFRDDKITEWEKEFGSYFEGILTRYTQAMSRKSKPGEPRNASFIMMHTFAHLLIKRLCFSCGYGSSSLRERIYFSSDPDNRMNGILIYTSSGDSEGSLGGLVRQGRDEHLGKLVKEAIEDARWCSADPVCSDIGQGSGQGPDSVNGSACHNCCIVPETSCEEFNMLLDRATIVGTLDENIGFFQV